ncbi:MAG: hypothetical protein ACT4O1_10410 [Gemmatimonadota bacterium]
MAEKHDFICAACGQEFDTREQLDTHNERQHEQQAGSRQGTSRKSREERESGRRTGQ